ncbi:MAG TPA: hypothetical protein VJV78_09645 [Polyangiales bacterium]|nr:hypothetical protein [Polyangiales bacterium]
MLPPVLRVVLIDAPDAANVVAPLERLVTAAGKALKVGLLARDSAPSDLKAAVRELGSRAPLTDCLIASSDAARARVASDVAVLVFHDRSELPLLVAARIGESAAPKNLEHALRFYLQSRHNLDLTAVEHSTLERISFRATAWHPLEGADLGDASGVSAPFPVEGIVARRPDGGVESVKISEPSDEALQEARSFVASLVQHGQLESHAAGQRGHGTHRITVDAQGRRRLIRSRVSYR